MNADELAQALKVTKREVGQWVKTGLPHGGSKRQPTFVLVEVEQWLIDKGLAEPTEQICTTYSDLAKALGMGGSDPERIIGRWAQQPGFPGTPGTGGMYGTPGRLPVEQIRTWLATRQRGGSRGHLDPEMQDLERERRRLELEVQTREYLQQLGQLADVEEVGRFCRMCVANTVAILEPIPDEVVKLLPTIDAEVVRTIHARIAQMIDDARLAISEILMGDRDEVVEDKAE